MHEGTTVKKARTAIIIALALAAAMLLAGCDGVKLTSTSVGGKTTIEAKDAADGTYGEAGPFSVGKGKTATIDSSLDKGELKIEFMEVAVFHNDEGPDDVINLDVVAGVTVGAGDKREIELERGDYILQYTTVGETNGKVTVNIG